VEVRQRDLQEDRHIWGAGVVFADAGKCDYLSDHTSSGTRGHHHQVLIK